jgi:methionyl-tRNA formyltransferase
MPNAPVRVAVFGSFYRGYYVLAELLYGRHRANFEVVGVATDDASQTFISAAKRVWQYPHRPDEETMVEDFAARHAIPVCKGRVKTEDFYALYEKTWRPDLCIAATFGQRINARLYRQPRLGFYNIHPCVPDGWPSRYAGPNPFQAMKDDGRESVVAALHLVDDGFDTGTLIAYSEPVAFPPEASIIDMHKLTSPLFARFAVETLAARVTR